MPSINFIGLLKERFEKEILSGCEGEGIKYEVDDSKEPVFRCTVTVPARLMGLNECWRRTGAECLGKKAAQQSAAEMVWNELSSLSQTDTEQGSDTEGGLTSSRSSDEGPTSCIKGTVDMASSLSLPGAGACIANVCRILLTGGPCGAKSTGIAMLKHILPGRVGGVVQTVDDFHDMSTNDENMAMSPRRRQAIQMERENIALAEAKEESRKANKQVILLIDRGILERGLEDAPPHAPSDVLERYDAVIHMMSPAVDKPEFYQRISKHGKPSLENAYEQDLQVRRCYQRHALFNVLWNGPDKGQAIPVWLGWKMKELLRIVSRACSTVSSTDCAMHQPFDVVDEWLRSQQLLEAFGSEKYAGVQETHGHLKQLLLKHLNGNEEWVTHFFDHVRYVRPLDAKGFTESLPEKLRDYVGFRMPGIIARDACACCADKEQASGKPTKVAAELLQAYRDAFRGQPPQVESYVDIGSGTCTTAAAVAKQLCLSKPKVTCLDVVESCGPCAGDVTFKLFDGKSLDFPSASVDLISVVHVLHHVEPGGNSMFALLQEAKRVLKPGGVMIIKEHDSPDKQYDLYLEAMHSLKQLVFYSTDPEKMPLGSYQSVAEWKMTFRRIGLPVVHVQHTDDIYRSVIMILENIADGESSC